MAFWVNNGYFSKCKIRLLKPLIECIEYIATSGFLVKWIEAAPMYFSNWISRWISFKCRPIWNFNWTRQPNLLILFLSIIILKDPSPSIKPDHAWGFLLVVEIWVEYFFLIVLFRWGFDIGISTLETEFISISFETL